MVTVTAARWKKACPIAERERIRRKTYSPREEAPADVFGYIKIFKILNVGTAALHSLSPVDFESAIFNSLQRA